MIIILNKNTDFKKNIGINKFTDKNIINNSKIPIRLLYDASMIITFDDINGGLKYIKNRHGDPR